MEELRALEAWDGRDRLASLAGLPTLVLSAAHDPIARPASMKALAEGIPGAQHVAFDDASHGLPIQHAEQVSQLLRSHIQGLPPVNQ
jgi:3-oxoadipate enol-lactonase